MNASSKHHELKLRQRLRCAYQDESSAALKAAVRKYLHSYDARLRAVDLANNSLRPNQRLPKSALSGIAEGLNPWKGSSEKVMVHLIFKDNGHDFRPIFVFGIEQRSLHQLVLPVLQATAQLHECQYALQGGVQQAITKVRKGLEDGFIHTAELDIRKFFSSLGQKGVAEALPLPKEVTRNVVLSHNLPIVVKSIPSLFSEDPEEMAICGVDVSQICVSEVPRGIPQGSGISPLVAEMVLSGTIGELAEQECCRIVNYADNVLVMAKSSKSCGGLGDNLSGLLMDHPAGPLLLNDPTYFEMGGPIVFLGHVLERIGGIVEVSPSDENLSRMRRRIRSSLRSAQQSHLPHSLALAKLKEIDDSVTGWTAAFKQWPGAIPFRNRTLARVDDVRKSMTGD